MRSSPTETRPQEGRRVLCRTEGKSAAIRHPGSAEAMRNQIRNRSSKSEVQLLFSSYPPIAERQNLGCPIEIARQWQPNVHAVCQRVVRRSIRFNCFSVFQMLSVTPILRIAICGMFLETSHEQIVIFLDLPQKLPKSTLAVLAPVGPQQEEDQQALPSPPVRVTDFWRSAVRIQRHCQLFLVSVFQGRGHRRYSIPDASGR